MMVEIVPVTAQNDLGNGPWPQDRLDSKLFPLFCGTKDGVIFSNLLSGQGVLSSS
jgi:hypothetical protein